MKIKTTAVLTAIILVIASVCAFAQGSCGENVSWSLNSGVLTISGSGAMMDYSKVLPAPWKDKSNEITDIVIENSVTKIGDWSFSGLANLKTLKLPSYLEIIGERSFYGCSSLEYISLPQSVKTISDGAFNSCTSLKRVDFSKNIEHIGTSAFMNLPLLKAVTLPKSITKIGDWAFFGNTGLEAMYFESIPENLGKNIISEPDGSFRAYVTEELGQQWLDNGIFSEDDLYIYFPEYRIPVFVNNSEVIFDQQPIIINSRTLVPVRAIFEAMNVTVDWDYENETVIATKGDTVIKIKIGADIMHKNGVPISIDSPAKIVGNRTLIPVRAISEAFDATVQWDDIKREVNITINK